MYNLFGDMAIGYPFPGWASSRIVLLVLLAVGVTAYNTSFETIKAVTKQGDT